LKQKTWISIHALLSGAAGIWALPALAHHSFVEYDFSRTIEVSGTLVDIAWRNPHVHFTVQSVPDEQGKVVTWDIGSREPGCACRLVAACPGAGPELLKLRSARSR
jgi:hypothetical protein